MGKSSVSLKKKRSKNSSKSRSMKKTKTKKSKSKKSRVRSVSISHSDDSDSRGSVSFSSSSSEEYDRRGRSRSRGRRDVKESKKRVRKRSYSSESSDSYKKSKGSSRNDKRSKRKKKARRDLSVSSTSSSCDDEREYKRKKRDKSKRRLVKVKGRDKISRDRSRSCSSISRHSENSSYEESKEVEIYPRRLKSVITVVKVVDNDEIDCDRNDYPSCKSHDSHDGGSYRKEFDLPLRDFEEEKGEEAVSNDRTDRGTDVPNMTNEIVTNKGDQVDDLELILRQKALENLKRFRGMARTKADPPAPTNQNSKEVKLSTASTDSVLSKTREVDSSLDGLNSANKVGSMKHGFVSPQAQVSGTISKEKVDATGGSYGNRKKLVSSVWRRESSNSGSITAPKPVVSAKEFPVPKSGSESSLNKTVTKTVLMPKSGSNSVEEIISVGNLIHETGSASSDNQQSKPNDVSKLEKKTMSVIHETGAVSSENQQSEPNDGSEFEKKTMTVMRGGEMVQVSYKVYIPKRASALARRQLRR